MSTVAGTDLPAALLAEAQLVHALDCVEGAGLRCAVLKGTPLARRLYGAIDSRGVPVDADLLVRRADVQGAVEALIAAGYRSPYLPAPVTQLKGIWKVVLRRIDEGGLSSTVELHWAPFSTRTFPLDESIVWRHIVPFTMLARSVEVPDLELCLVLLSCHLAQSGLASEKILRDLETAWALWSREIDAGVLTSLLVEARARAAFAYATAVAGIGTGPRSAQAALLARIFPRGRRSKAGSGPDYLGQLAALALCQPSRLPIEVLRHLLPSRAHIAVATDTPIPGVDRYASEVAARAQKITRALFKSAQAAALSDAADTVVTGDGR